MFFGGAQGGGGESYRRILDCISSKFLKRVSKILISLNFFIVEPPKEPFSYLKTDLN